MKKSRVAIAAIALILAAGVAIPSHAEESRGGAAPDVMKAPRKQERPSTRNPTAPGTPVAKPDNPKIIYF